MIRIEHEVEIRRRPEEVFAYVTDPAKLPEWQATAIEARLESEQMQKGARVREVRKVLGRRLESTMEVTEYEPDRRYDLDVSSGPVKYRASQTFEPSDEGTRIHVVLEGEPAGFFRLADPLVERQIRRQLEDDFATLRLVLESGAD